MTKKLSDGEEKASCCTRFMTKVRLYFSTRSNQHGKTKSGKVQSKPVNVEVRDLKWFFRNRKNFIAFSYMLEALPPSFY